MGLDTSSSDESESYYKYSSPKRKRSSVPPEVQRTPRSSKRLKADHEDEYRKLLNKEIRDAASIERRRTDNQLESSQLGCVTWSSQEKSVALAQVARSGRFSALDLKAHHLRKSAIEIGDYIKRLQTFTNISNKASNIVAQNFDIAKVSAAVEVSRDCEVAVDGAATAVEDSQIRNDEVQEKELHGDLWLLTHKTGKWATQCARRGAQGEKEVLDILPAAQLLNLEMFVQLSRQVFMNSSDTELNWRTHASLSRKPSILHSAFSDFHTLTLSFIKRLVQSSLALAISRGKAESRHGRSLIVSVRRCDVLAAVDIMRLKPNAELIWIELARKHKLRVVEHIRHKQAWGRSYTHDEVEDDLRSTSRGRRRRYSRSTSRENESGPDSQTSQEGRLDEDIFSHDEGSMSSNQDLSASSPDSSSSLSNDSELSIPALSQRDQQSQDFEDYLEALDKHKSRTEEQRLWRILGEDPADHIDMNGADTSTLPRRCYPPLRTDEELRDWTDRITYRAEWEDVGTSVPESAFQKNRAVRSEEEAEDLIYDTTVGGKVKRSNETVKKDHDHNEDDDLDHI